MHLCCPPPSMVAFADVDMHRPPRILWSTSSTQGLTRVLGLIDIGCVYDIWIYTRWYVACIFSAATSKRVQRISVQYIERVRDRKKTGNPAKQRFVFHTNIYIWPCHYTAPNPIHASKKRAHFQEEIGFAEMFAGEGNLFSEVKLAGHPSVATDIEYAQYFTALLEGTKSNPFDILSTSGLLCLGAFQTLKLRNQCFCFFILYNLYI